MGSANLHRADSSENYVSRDPFFECGDVPDFFVSDLHGTEVCFRKFLNAVDAYHPDALVYGGPFGQLESLDAVEAFAVKSVNFSELKPAKHPNAFNGLDYDSKLEILLPRSRKRVRGRGSAKPGRMRKS